MTEEERQPLHEETSNRLDHSRVEAVLAGRDIHLTRFERRAAVHIAYERGVSEQRLGWLLKISEEHAQKLYREIRRAHRNVRLDLERPADITPRLEVDDERHGRNGFGTAA
jgi:WhiB family redox-sensing transcriptional regulator